MELIEKTPSKMIELGGLIVANKQTCFRNQEGTKKHWFCKHYQTDICSFNMDHEVGRKTHKHICAFVWVG